jgi:acid phosphatase type 7
MTVHTCFFKLRASSGRLATAILLPLAFVAVGAVGQQLSPSAAASKLQPQTAVDDLGGPTFTVSDLPMDRPLRIVVYGDMRFTDPSDTSNTSPRVRQWLVEKVSEERPDILLLTGDMPFHGSNPKDWAVYRQETAIWESEHLRIYPTVGNHEVIPNRKLGMQYYFQNYPQIEGHKWYSVQMGNIYLITLDSSIIFADGPQRDWLDAQLAHLPASTNFVFLLFHVPMVADLQTAFLLGIPSPGILDLRQSIEAAAAKSRARFVAFNGHIHNYERFDLNGVMHVISGGGGAAPYPIFLRGDEDLYRAHTYPNFNYLLITLQGKHAEAKMYRVVDPKAAQMSVEIKDSFNLDAK